MPKYVKVARVSGWQLISVAQALYVSALFLYCVSYYLGSVNAVSIFGVSLSHASLVFQVCALALIFLKLVMQRLSHSLIIAGLCLVGLCAVSLLTNWATPIVWLLVFAVSLPGVDWRGIPKAVLSSAVIVSLFTAGLCLTGVIEPVVMQRGSAFARSSLGFAHPNNFGQIVFVAWSAYATLTGGGSRFRAVTVACVAAILFVADSRTSAAAIVMFSIVRFVFLQRGANCLPRARFFVAVFLVVGVVSVALPLAWSGGGAFIHWLDGILTNRIYYAAWYFDNYPISLFGTSFSKVVSLPSASGLYVIESKIMLDNAYCRLLVQYGVVPFIIFMTVYVRLICQERRPVLLCGLVSYTLIGFVECSMLYVGCNFFLLAATADLMELGQRDRRPEVSEGALRLVKD